MRTDVVIVGGGLSGLAAAVALSDAGVRVTLIERESFLGGRASSFVAEQTGDPVSIGPHVVLDAYSAFFSLLDRCGTRDRIAWQDDRLLTLADEKRAIVVGNPRFPGAFGLIPSFVSDPKLSLSELASNWRIALRALMLRQRSLLELDRRSARELLEADGVAPAFIDRVWEFTSLAILGAPLDRCSAGALVRFATALIRRRIRIGLPAVGLSELYVPGACQIVEAAGGQVLRGAAVRAISASSRRATGIELADGEQIRAAAVIAAVGPNALRRLLPAQWRELAPFAALGRFLPVPYVSLQLWFEDKLAELAFWARADAPTSFNTDFYDLSNIYQGYGHRPSIIASNMIFAERAWSLPDDELVAVTRREIAEFIPRAARSRILHSRIHRIRMAIPLAAPGMEALRPSAQTPIESLFLAGDWTDTGLPFSMESAARSGQLAARAVLAASVATASAGRREFSRTTGSEARRR
jgi:squalene-associated FAD-dependent desaturase